VALSLRLDAQQTRTTKEGVYSAAQAKRGEAVYQEKCVACHGAKLEGDFGPPLTGEAFLGIWGGLSLSELFDKIHNTMPADAPGTLTRPQAVDVVAYVAQANQAPAGATDLAEPALKQIVLAAAPGAADALGGGPSRPAGTTASFPATGTVNQVMRGILFPSSNVLFDVQTTDPGAQGKGGAAHPDAAPTTARYGNVYEPWQIVDAAAISIAEIGPILMTPGRRCENGKPAPVDRADWQQYVQGLVDAGRAAYKASQTRDQATVSDVTNVISDACANCHRVYRDVPTNAGRCAPPKP
jgi:mono/diheme cytochrome c family protein